MLTIRPNILITLLTFFTELDKVAFSCQKSKYKKKLSSLLLNFSSLAFRVLTIQNQKNVKICFISIKNKSFKSRTTSKKVLENCINHPLNLQPGSKQQMNVFVFEDKSNKPDLITLIG